MSSVKGYVFSLVVIGILCAVIRLFFEKNNNLLPLIKLVTGVMITVIAIKPLVNIDQSEFIDSLDVMDVTGECIVKDAEQQARVALEKYITEKTVAYISDEAAKLGASVIVDVSLNNDSIQKPVAVTLQGNVSPYVQERINRMIITDLGICEDSHTF